MEIKIDKWLYFYEPFFSSREAAYQFVSTIEELCPEDIPHPTKIMMHQVQRLITLADDIPKIRNGNETLPLLFLLICAEHIAKMYHRFDGEGQSRNYVRRFFEEFLSEDDKEAIRLGITGWDRKPSTIRHVVDALYDVRCDLVHEGRYWGFHFHDGHTSMLNGQPDVIVNLRLEDLRNIVVRGAINAINDYQGQI